MNGHLRTAKNLYIKPNNGTRGCRLCRATFAVVRNKLLSQKRLKARLAYEAVRSFKKPSLNDLNWAAGCFDGEGTVTISSGGVRNFPQPRVMLGNTDRQVVDFYVKRWGGSVYRPKPPSERARRPFMWKVGARNMRWFLRDVLPFTQRQSVREKINLVLKIEKARIAAPHAKATRRLVRQAVKRIRRLNRRGRV